MLEKTELFKVYFYDGRVLTVYNQVSRVHCIKKVRSVKSYHCYTAQIPPSISAKLHIENVKSTDEATTVSRSGYIVS